MSSREHFILTDLKVGPGTLLTLTYTDGFVGVVDLAEWITNTKALAQLQDSDLFAQAHLDPGGWTVEWIDDELHLAADNLRNLAIEQAGGIGHERIWNWLYRNNLSPQEGAQALGISQRMLTLYQNCKRPIPRHIWLACLGWEVIRHTNDPQPKTIPSAQQYAQWFD